MTAGPTWCRACPGTPLAWPPVASAAGQPGAGTECAAPQQDPAPGDVNGDGFGDVLCLGEAVGERLAPTTSSVLHRWMPADVTGTGRQSLVSVRFTNPGYEVFTLHRSATGTWARTMQAISPSADAPGLTEPDAGGWMPVDVGSPSDGKPDGKADLIRIDRYGGQLRVLSLLSTGTGWEPRVDRPWTEHGTVVPYPAHDLQSWRPAQLNKDGRTDFVRLAALSTGCPGRDAARRRRRHLPQRRRAPSACRRYALTLEDASGFRSPANDGSGLTSFAYVRPGDPAGCGLWRGTATGRGRSAQPRWRGGSAGGGPGVYSCRPQRRRTGRPGRSLREPGLPLRPRTVVYRFGVDLPAGHPDPGARRELVRRPGPQPDAVRRRECRRQVDISYLSATSGPTGTSPTTTTARALLNLPAGWTLREAGLPLPAKDTWAYAALDLDVDGRADLLLIAADKLTTVTFAPPATGSSAPTTASGRRP